MDGEVTVPISWLFYVAAVLIGFFVWWIRVEFARNWKDHDALRKEVVGIHKRIDHIILHTPSIPEYKED